MHMMKNLVIDRNEHIRNDNTRFSLSVKPSIQTIGWRLLESHSSVDQFLKGKHPILRCNKNVDHTL